MIRRKLLRDLHKYTVTKVFVDAANPATVTGLKRELDKRGIIATHILDESTACIF
jgi:hypothetical protein